jgi:lipoprotein NlpI
MLQVGKEEEILRSLEAIPHQSPWHANARAELGVAYTYQGRYEQAASEFKAIIEADPYVYYHLFYALSLHRVGRAEESRVYLREFAESFEGDPWESSLLDFLTGELDEATLLSLAKSEDPKTEREQECEAFYYIGTAYLLETDAVLESRHPDTAKAQAYFEKCLGTGIWQFLEYFSARGELDRLKRN